MIQVNDFTWVDKNSIERCYIKEGNLIIFLKYTRNIEYVKKEFIPEVCSTLGISLGLILARIE